MTESAAFQMTQSRNIGIPRKTNFTVCSVRDGYAMAGRYH